MFLNLTFFFYFLILFSALLMTFSNNPIHSVLFLIAIFVNVSIIFILFNVDFLGLLILIVYIGAIAILFLFMVMMLNIKKIENEYNIYLLIGLIILCTFLLQMFYFYYNFTLNTYLCMFFLMKRTPINMKNQYQLRFYTLKNKIYTLKYYLFKHLYKWSFFRYIRRLFYNVFVGKIIGTLHCTVIHNIHLNPVDYDGNVSVNYSNYNANICLLRKHTIQNITFYNTNINIYNCRYQKTSSYKSNEVYFYNEDGNWYSLVFFYSNIATFSLSNNKQINIPFLCSLNTSLNEIDSYSNISYQKLDINCEYLINIDLMNKNDFEHNFDTEHSIKVHLLYLFNTKYYFNLHISNILNLIINKKKKFSYIINKKNKMNKTLLYNNSKKRFHINIKNQNIKPYFINALLLMRKYNKHLFNKYPENKKILDGWFKDSHFLHFLRNKENKGFFNINGKNYVLCFNLTSNKSSEINLVDNLSPKLKSMIFYNSVVLLTESEFFELLEEGQFCIGSKKAFFHEASNSFIINRDIKLSEKMINEFFSTLTNNLTVKYLNNKLVSPEFKEAVLFIVKTHCVVFTLKEETLKKEFNIIKHNLNIKTPELYFDLNNPPSYDDEDYLEEEFDEDS